MADYKKLEFKGDDTKTVLRTSDGATIPLTDDGNMDYIEYKEWLAAGNTPDPA